MTAPNIYQQAREAARDDPTMTELLNMLHDLPHVFGVGVDGDDEDWRPTIVRINFDDEMGRGTSQVLDIMHIAGWRPAGVCFTARNRITFKRSGVTPEDTDSSAREEPTRSEPADFGYGESTGVQDL